MFFGGRGGAAAATCLPTGLFGMGGAARGGKGGTSGEGGSRTVGGGLRLLFGLDGFGNGVGGLFFSRCISLFGIVGDSGRGSIGFSPDIFLSVGPGRGYVPPTWPMVTGGE